LSNTFLICFYRVFILKRLILEVLPDMATHKITNNLKDHLLHAEKEATIEVVIALQPVLLPGGSELLSRSQKMANIKQAFNEELEPVAREINNLGGNILEAAWINQTINVKVSTGCIEELAQLKEVAGIDLPTTLTRE